MPRVPPPNSTLVHVPPEDQTPRQRLAEAQALSTRLSALNEVSVTLQSNRSLDELLPAIVREARWIVDFHYCSVRLDEGEQYHEYLLRSDGLQHQQHKKIVPGGIVERTAKSGRPQLLRSLEADDDVPAETKAALVLPLRDSSRVVGVLTFYNQNPQGYTLNDLLIANAFAAQIGSIYENISSYAAATSARDRLDTVLQSINDGVLVLDRNGRVLLVNEALRQILQLPDTSVPDKTIVQFLRPSRGPQIVTRKDLRATLDQWQSGITMGVLQTTDGRSCEWRLMPLLDIGTSGGYVISIRDISERLELERLRDTMIGMLVHDLRTPLTSLIAGLDMFDIYQEMKDYVSANAMITQTRYSANRLLKQINMILDVRKMQAGRMDIVCEPNDIHLVARMAVRELQPLAVDSSQSLVVEVANDVPVLFFDTNLIQRTLENMIGNAIKFTPRQGTITISARRVPSQPWVEIEVCDTGPGVPPGMKAAIFEEYGQAHQAKRRGGTGLGLTFCRLVVTAHSGQIGVRDAPGGGSIFWFTLPISADMST